MTTLQTPLQRAKALAARMDVVAGELTGADKDSKQYWYWLGAFMVCAESLSAAVKQLTDEDAS